MGNLHSLLREFLARRSPNLGVAMFLYLKYDPVTFTRQ